MSRLVQRGETSVALGARPDPKAPDTWIVTIGEHHHTVQARRTGEGTLLVTLADGRTAELAVTRDAQRWWVTGGGRTTVVAEAEAAGRAHAHEGGLEAPMPGKVLAVKVAPGDRVAAGATLLIVEAMKMEHAIKAPHAGVVREVAAREGDMVSPGTPLVTLDREEDA